MSLGGTGGENGNDIINIAGNKMDAKVNNEVTIILLCIGDLYPTDDRSPIVSIVIIFLCVCKIFTFIYKHFFSRGINDGRSASHLISSSEPHSAHFLVRATSKCLSFVFSFFKVPLSVVLKHFSKIRPR